MPPVPALPIRLGHVVITPAAAEAIERTCNNRNLFTWLQSHSFGKCEHMSVEDQAQNGYNVRNSLRIHTCWPLGDGQKLWIITEHDRSVTTLLMPDDY